MTIDELGNEIQLLQKSGYGKERVVFKHTEEEDIIGGKTRNLDVEYCALKTTFEGEIVFTLTTEYES